MSDLEDDRWAIRQMHETGRHSIQMLVVWFTFFITVNYAGIGWVMTAKASPPTALVLTAAGLFVFQNLLGLIMCSVAVSYFKRSGKQLSKLSTGTKLARRDLLLLNYTLPCGMYACVARLMIVTLLSVAAAWVFLGVYFSVHAVPPGGPDGVSIVVVK